MRLFSIFAFISLVFCQSNQYAPSYGYEERTVHLLTNLLRANPRFALQYVITNTRQGSCASNAPNDNSMLVYHSKLKEASAFQCRTMADNNVFQHDTVPVECKLRFGGDCSMSKRVWHFYKYVNIGENLGSGFSDPIEIMRGWVNSDGHCTNLIAPVWVEMGISYDRRYFCQTFGGKTTVDQLKPPGLVVGSHISWPDASKVTFMVVLWGSNGTPGRIWMQLGQQTHGLKVLVGSVYFVTLNAKDVPRGSAYFFRADKLPNTDVQLRYPASQERLVY